ncbi:unnamed protein product [Amoebophrya sp. A25]|nr:unnamed protein product [Amoebophrya sp. A25]|eukprot:GSA25T00022567001.1
MPFFDLFGGSTGIADGNHVHDASYSGSHGQHDASSSSGGMFSDLFGGDGGGTSNRPAPIDEHEFMSRLVDAHYGLPTHGDTEKQLGTALSALSQHSEASNEHAISDGVFSLAAKKWIFRGPPEKPVDPLEPQPSLKLPPEHEQAVLRQTIQQVLSEKVTTAVKDLRKLDKMREILEKPQPADLAWKEAIQARLEDLPAGGNHELSGKIESEVPAASIAHKAGGIHGVVGGSLDDGLDDGMGGAQLVTKQDLLLNPLTGQLVDSIGDHLSAGPGPATENLFLWKADAHEFKSAGAEDAEPYVVVRDHNAGSGTTAETSGFANGGGESSASSSSSALQLLPLRSALAYGDNRELWYRDAAGHIYTPDKSMVVDVDAATGTVTLKETGLDGSVPQADHLTGPPEEWKLQDDGTLQSGAGKEYLQFPGTTTTFVDTRLLDPISVSSNVPDIPEHPASFAVDDNPHHFWLAPHTVGKQLPLASGAHGSYQHGHPYLVVDAGGPKYIENMQLEFTDPPREFLVSGSADNGHSWQKIFGTDLNAAYNVSVPVLGKFSHLKVTFLEPLRTTPLITDGQFGVRHVDLYGKQSDPPFVGGYPIFGPIGHYQFEHLRGPLPDVHKVDRLLELGRQLDVATSKLSLAEERYDATLDQTETPGSVFLGSSSLAGAGSRLGGGLSSLLGGGASAEDYSNGNQHDGGPGGEFLGYGSPFSAFGRGGVAGGESAAEAATLAGKATSLPAEAGAFAWRTLEMSSSALLAGFVFITSFLPNSIQSGSCVGESGDRTQSGAALEGGNDILLADQRGGSSFSSVRLSGGARVSAGHIFL